MNILALFLVSFRLEKKMNYGLMDGAVRMVSFRFSFSNVNLIPDCLQERFPANKIQENETPSQYADRMADAKGEKCFEPVENVGCLPFYTGIKSDYALVDAFFQILSKAGKDYAVVRFDFCALQHVFCSEEWANEMCPKAEQALHKLLEKNMWRTRAFLNPFFFEGHIIEDQFALSVNLEARRPLFTNKGEPVLVWEKDEQGQRIGEAPVKLHPKLFLKVVNGDIAITT